MAFLVKCPASLCKAPKRVEDMSGRTRCNRCGVSFHAWVDKHGVTWSEEGWGSWYEGGTI